MFIFKTIEINFSSFLKSIGNFKRYCFGFKFCSNYKTVIDSKNKDSNVGAIAM